MGTGIAEDVILKAMGGASALALFVWFVIYFGKILVAHLEKKDATFAGALDKIGAALDKVGTDMKAVSSEMKGAIDTVKATIVEIDRAHTANNNQTFQLLISLNDKQGNVIGVVIQKVDHLDQAVKELASKQDMHGVKLDLITRGMPGLTAELVAGAQATRAAERASDRVADRAIDRAAMIEGK